MQSEKKLTNMNTSMTPQMSISQLQQVSQHFHTPAFETTLNNGYPYANSGIQTSTTSHARRLVLRSSV